MDSNSQAQRLISDRYLLLDRLGRGGMGTVWRATDQLLDRTVAVKEVHLQAGGEERAKQVRRAHREARALARVSHPHVVNVYDLVAHEEQIWLVMELVDGPSLADQVDTAGPLAPHRIAAVGLQLLGAVEAVHAVGALHRDIKPANVLLRPDGSAVLCDFGIAALSDTESLTAPDTVMGSLAFMAPERLMGEQAGPPSDLFSLGSTLCALLSGRSPFARPERVAVMHAVAREQPDLPQGAGPLRPVLEALLRKDPEGRPSATEVAGMLRPLAAHATPHADVSERTTPLRARLADAPAEPKRRLLRRIVLPTTLLLLAGVTSGLLASHWPGEDQKRAGHSGKPSPTGSDAVSGDHPTPVDEAIPTPDNPAQFWLFSGGQYVRTNASASKGPVRETEIPPSPISRWNGTFADLPGFRTGIDAVLPVPAHRNEYWVFSKDRYVRIRIDDGASYTDTLLKRPAPLSDWSSTLGRLPGSAGGIDAVMRTPDDPQQFWVFRKGYYIRIRLDGAGPGGRATAPLPLAEWSTLARYPDFRSGIDAAMTVPGGHNDYWVLSGGHYIKIRVADVSYEDALLQEPRPLPDWDDLGDGLP